MTVADILAGVTVEIGFGVDAVPGNYFVLNDPVKGVLDNVTYLLAPDTVYVDVSQYVSAISTDRGRDRELDEYATGKATVVFNDVDRTFDPAYSGSPWFGEIVPMKRIAIRWGTADLFTGWIEDWSVFYEAGDTMSRVTAECVDAFAILANQELSEIGPSFSGDLSGDRITRVLDRNEIDFPASRAIDAGNSTLGATTLGENALSYIQACARAEAGYLFVAADGTLTFLNRTAPLNDDAAVTFSDDRTAGVPYRDVTQRSATDLLYTRVTGTSETTSNEMVATDTAAADRFLIRTLSLGTLFTINDAQTQSLVDYHLSRFSTPELRFQAATIETGTLDAAQVADLVHLELTDVVTVQRSPLNVGPMIERLSIVDGVSHQISKGGKWVTELSFANADTKTFLTLDDPVFGVLGSNRLAF